MAVRLFLIIVLYTVLSMGAAAQVNEFRDRLLPAPMDGGFRMDGYWVWCGSVIKGDDANIICSPRAGQRRPVSVRIG